MERPSQPSIIWITLIPLIGWRGCRLTAVDHHKAEIGAVIIEEILLDSPQLQAVNSLPLAWQRLDVLVVRVGIAANAYVMDG